MHQAQLKMWANQQCYGGSLPKKSLVVHCTIAGMSKSKCWRWKMSKNGGDFANYLMYNSLHQRLQLSFCLQRETCVVVYFFRGKIELIGNHAFSAALKWSIRPPNWYFCQNTFGGRLSHLLGAGLRRLISWGTLKLKAMPNSDFEEK